MNAPPKKAVLIRAYKFFRENAGWVVGQNAQGALALARAELKAEELGRVFAWEGDEDGYDTVSDYHDPKDGTCPIEALRKRYEEGDGFIRDQILKAKLAPTYPESSYGRTYKRVGGWCDHEVEVCVVYAEDDESRDHPLASLGGIIDADDTYRRVVEAELAMDALDALNRQDAHAKANAKLRDTARELYGQEGQIKIDPGAEVIREKGGAAWVEAWVRVEKET